MALRFLVLDQFPKFGVISVRYGYDMSYRLGIIWLPIIVHSKRLDMACSRYDKAQFEWRWPCAIEIKVPFKWLFFAVLLNDIAPLGGARCSEPRP